MTEVRVRVEWLDGDGNTWTAPPVYPWPEGVPLPLVGDLIEWPGVAPDRGSAEVVGRRWTLDSAGPALLLACDLGAYSGGVLKNWT